MAERHILDRHGPLHTLAEHELAEDFYSAERIIHERLNDSTFSQFPQITDSIRDSVRKLFDEFVRNANTSIRIALLQRMYQLIQEIETFTELAPNEKVNLMKGYIDGIVFSTTFLLRQSS